MKWHWRVSALIIVGFLYSSASMAYPLYYSYNDQGQTRTVLVTDGKVPRHYGTFVNIMVPTSDFPPPLIRIRIPAFPFCETIQEGEVYELSVTDPAGKVYSKWIKGVLEDGDGEACKLLANLILYWAAYTNSTGSILGLIGPWPWPIEEDRQVPLSVLGVTCDTPLGTYTVTYNGKSTSFELVTSTQVKLRPLSSGTQPPSTFTNLTKKASTRDYEVSVVDNCSGGVTIPNADVTLDYTAVPYSGGHNHHDKTRPNGIFNLAAVNYTSEPNGITPLRVNTGSTGTAIVKYTAPQVAGQTKVTMTCTLPDGSTCESRDATVDIGVSGLSQLPLSTQYDLVGAEPFLFHLENHYGTPALNQALIKLAEAYITRYPGNKLKYNDMSLPQGGLFDCFESPGCASAGGTPWSPPHKGHRLGMDADLSFKTFDGLELLERKRRMLFVAEELIPKTNGLKIGYKHGDHWHLTVK